MRTKTIKEQMQEVVKTVEVQSRAVEVAKVDTAEALILALTDYEVIPDESLLAVEIAVVKGLRVKHNHGRVVKRGQKVFASNGKAYKAQVDHFTALHQEPETDELYIEALDTSEEKPAG